MQDNVRWVVGTANFFGTYGWDKQSCPSEDIKKIVCLPNVKFDVSSSYGNNYSFLDSEQAPKITLKLSSGDLERLTEEFDYDLRSFVSNSLLLNRFEIQDCLIHDPIRLSSRYLSNEFNKLREKFPNVNFGVSIYDFEILDGFLPYEIAIIQCPLNLFDRRVLDTEFFNRVIDGGAKLQVRSLFLQGLLLADWQDFTLQFPFLDHNYSVKSWFESSDRLNSAVSVLKALPPEAEVVVGVNSWLELKQIMQGYSQCAEDCGAFCARP